MLTLQVNVSVGSGIAAGATVIEIAALAITPASSVTEITAADVPAVEGVPFTRPEAETNNPDGKPDPENEYGKTPPEAVTVAEYATPTTALGNTVVVIASGAGGGGSAVTVTVAVAILVESAWLTAVTEHTPAEPGAV